MVVPPPPLPPSGLGGGGWGVGTGSRIWYTSYVGDTTFWRNTTLCTQRCRPAWRRERQHERQLNELENRESLENV